ncbi:carbohydrate ABC transporter substrate-binding protein [Pseudobutyrivibrio sp.]|jgi:hypothetical protein|uniref:carbohydrate ABC transporter substrate-binding protein n=1 Tax=Pseudobutyrivibrio sp. TaxID=2014367 RepID=UPI001D4D6CBD|nr:carbohydrate ABC transporter substrate-binding protein [Pseudobutyrivibrio sp.]MBE5910581.1 ABC transporter substrate-binding protein [Pseudobutyrivibrio sp.]
MKRRLVSLLAIATMTASMVAGCGTTSMEGTSSSEDAAPKSTEEIDAEAESVELAEDTGKVLNIYVWNEEFKSRVTDHYPGYEEVDATHGKIGDVDVVWQITENQGNSYQDNLDTALKSQADAADDDKVDIFLIEADYASKYCDTDYTMALSDLGITSEDLGDQYEYTQTIVKDSAGKIKGSSWQAASAGLIYNRDIALEVLGTEDPEEVQAAVADWDKYNETAGKMADAGYTMCSVMDTYRTYSNNVSGKWVQDNKVVVDDNLMNWVDDSMELVDANAETTYALWGDDWAKGKYPEGKQFCYFGPAWFFNFCLDADKEGTVANSGRWGFCEGPQSYYWGGTWICAATGTDNPNLVKDIILTMTTDQTVLKEIAQDDLDCVNSKTVLDELASSDEGNMDILGGQNPYAQLAAGAEGIDLSNLSPYDQGCNEEFQNAMKNYFEGNATKDEALELFKTAIVEKYPTLTAE